MPIGSLGHRRHHPLRGRVIILSVITGVVMIYLYGPDLSDDGSDSNRAAVTAPPASSPSSSGPTTTGTAPVYQVPVDSKWFTKGVSRYSALEADKERADALAASERLATTTTTQVARSSTTTTTTKVRATVTTAAAPTAAPTTAAPVTQPPTTEPPATTVDSTVAPAATP